MSRKLKMIEISTEQEAYPYLIMKSKNKFYCLKFLGNSFVIADKNDKTYVISDTITFLNDPKTVAKLISVGQMINQNIIEQYLEVCMLNTLITFIKDNDYILYYNESLYKIYTGSLINSILKKFL